MNASKQEIIQNLNKYLSISTIDEIKDKQGSFKFPVFKTKEFMETDITHLELSVRSYNCLKRAGLGSVGEIVEYIDDGNNLYQIRNLGKKSASEIMMNIFLFHYSTIKTEKQFAYVEEIKKMNSLVR